MGDLREQLLKAKLIDESKARDAKREKRQKRKQKGVRALEIESQKKAEAFRKEMISKADRDKEKARLKQEHERRDTKDIRIRQLIVSNVLSGKISGPVKFYFITRKGFIPCLEVSSEIADSLRSGKIAILEQPGLNREVFSVVPRDTAIKVQVEAPDLIRFFNSE